MLSVIQEENIDQTEQEENDNSSATFEEILDDYIYESPKRGQILEGAIEAIDEDAIILDVGLKRDAIVPGREMSELEDDEFENLSIGDVIPIQVTKTPVGDQDLIVSIDNALEYQSWQKAQVCLDEDEMLDLEVIGSNRGGVLVEFDKLEGFVPNSHLPTLRKIHNPDQLNKHKQKMKGEEIKVKPIEVNPKRSRLVFSATEAKKSERVERLKNLEEGEVIEGKVVNVVHFGVFVDLGGIDGLVHISELDWLTVRKPSSVAKVGDDMEVKVIGNDVERERVQLSRKALLPDPWDEIESKYVPGDLVEVEITSVVDFGAFARLPEGIQGLIHITELGYTAPGNAKEAVEKGTTVLVKIIRIEADRQRIALSMRKVPMEKQIDWMLQDFDLEEEEEAEAAPSQEETSETESQSEPEDEPQAEADLETEAKVEAKVSEEQPEAEADLETEIIVEDEEVDSEPEAEVETQPKAEDEETEIQPEAEDDPASEEASEEGSEEASEDEQVESSETDQGQEDQEGETL